jgi:hypothetical protein
MNRCLFLTPLLLLLCGCQAIHITRVMSVPPSASEQAVKSRQEPETVDGMPFYVKKVACKHEIVWFEPIYTLTLEEIKADKDKQWVIANWGSRTLSRSEYSKAGALLQAIVDQTDVVKQWRDLWPKTVEYKPENYSKITSDNKFLASASDSPTTYVDNTVRYFLNVRQPLAGSAKVNWKLASDGTLTEGSAEVEDKTVETAASALPTSSKAAAAAPAALAPGLAPAPAPAPARAPAPGPAPAPPATIFRLTVTVSGYKHTFTKIDLEESTPCVAMVLPDGNWAPPAGATYSREYVSDLGSDGKEKQSKSAIKVSGTIVLPEKTTDDE